VALRYKAVGVVLTSTPRMRECHADVVGREEEDDAGLWCASAAAQLQKARRPVISCRTSAHRPADRPVVDGRRGNADRAVGGHGPALLRLPGASFDGRLSTPGARRFNEQLRLRDEIFGFYTFIAPRGVSRSRATETDSQPVADNLRNAYTVN